jgi:hypothetical protein
MKEEEKTFYPLYSCLILVIVTERTPNGFLNYLDKLGCKAKVKLGKWK